MVTGSAEVRSEWLEVYVLSQVIVTSLEGGVTLGGDHA